VLPEPSSRSQLRITAVARAPAGDVYLELQGGGGRIVIVQAASTLGTNAFTVEFWLRDDNANDGIMGIQGASAGPARIDARIYEVQLKYAWTLSRGTWNVRRNVLVRIEKDGTSGMGEAAPIARYNETAESGLAFIDKALAHEESKARPLYEGGLAATDTASSAALISASKLVVEVERSATPRLTVTWTW
jgi:hypothetical protein